MNRKFLCHFIMILVLAAGFFSGCGSNEIVVNPNGFYLYYLDNEGVSLKQKSYSLKGKTTEEKVSEILTLLSDEGESGDYNVSIPKNVEVMEYELKNGILELHFSKTYKDLSAVPEVMLRASLVKTMMQLDDVNAVEFYVENKPLTDSSGKEFGAQNDETFLTSFGEETDDIESDRFTLYYVSENGKSLVKVETTIYYTSNSALESLVLEHLAEDPQKKGARAAIAEGVRVLDVSVSDGICYVDVDQNFLSQTTGISTQAAVYAIVDSLTELNGIDKVQLLINNENEAVVSGETFSGLYEPDYSLVKNK